MPRRNIGAPPDDGPTKVSTRVLLIDDDTVFLELLEELLRESEGFEVTTCKEWGDAYGAVQREQPDLVLLDIVMEQEERGWRILELLTLDPKTRPIPVIVCSAAIHSLHEHQPLLDRYGVMALPKPFDLDALLETIGTALSQHGRASDRP